MKISQEFLDKFSDLKREFAANVCLRLKAIEDTLQEVMMQPEDEDRLHALHRLLHSLGGTAGSFGFVQLGLDARKIESQIVALVGCPNRSAKDFMLIAKAVSELDKDNALLMDGSYESIARKDVAGVNSAVN